MMTARRKVVALIMMIGITTVCTSCASSLDKNLDDTRKALNDGDWATAITKATAATQDDSSNLEAFLLLCGGYSGQAGVKLLELTKQLTDTSTSGDAFDFVHDTLFNTMTTQCTISSCLQDLNNAITTLTTTFTGNVANYETFLQEQYYFQLGILQFIRALGGPTLVAQPSLDGAITQTDVTAALTTTAQNDFINAYTNLTNAVTGIAADNALVTALVQNYWTLKNAALGVNVNSGFSQGVLQDQVLCQLSPNAATAAPSTVASCATFDFTKACNNKAPAEAGIACTK